MPEAFIYLTIALTTVYHSPIDLGSEDQWMESYYGMDMIAVRFQFSYRHDILRR